MVSIGSDDDDDDGNNGGCDSKIENDATLFS